MGAFRDLCVGCQVDFWPIHLTDFPLATWSEGRDTMAYLKDYVCEAYRVGGGKPLWITEVCFFSLCSPQIILSRRTVCALGCSRVQAPDSAPHKYPLSASHV